jgi:LysM repeat protein
MWNATPRSYTDADGHNTIVASFEHTMILTGYDQTYVYVVDSFSGQNQIYGVQSFLSSWAVLGNMAVTGYADRLEDGNENQPEGEALPASLYTGETYTVQRGDYLIALAERFGISWQELAARNNIRYPYMIYPGQVLEVPGSKTLPEEAIPTQEPTSAPALAPTAPPPTAIPVVIKREDIFFRLYLPKICLNCQLGNLAAASRGVPRLRRSR